MFDWTHPIVVLALVISSIIGTPGPNNSLLFIAGLHYSFRKSIPSLIAISLGALSLIFIAILATELIENFIAVAYDYLKYLSAALLLYISYSIWTNADKQEKNLQHSSSSNMSEEVVLKTILSPTRLYFFQFINPKVWLASLSIVTIFKPEVSVSMILVTTGITGFFWNSLWVLLGIGVRKLSLNIANSVLSKVGAVVLFLCIPYFLFS